MSGNLFDEFWLAIEYTPLHTHLAGWLHPPKMDFDWLSNIHHYIPTLPDGSVGLSVVHKLHIR